MKFLSKVVFLIVTALLIAINAHADNSSNVINMLLLSKFQIKSAQIQPGDTEIIKTATIKKDDKTISFKSPHFADKYIILDKNVNNQEIEFEVNIGTTTTKIDTLSGIHSKKNIYIDFGVVEFFEFPLLIKIPFDTNLGMTPVPFRIDPQLNKLESVYTSRIDFENGYVEIESPIGGDSIYTIIYENNTEAISKASRKFIYGSNKETVDTGFDPKKDGFNRKNIGYGNILNNGGNCVGMSTWAAWWFKNIKPTKGNFIGKYLAEVGKGFWDNGDLLTLYGQDVIARRAQESIAPGEVYLRSKHTSLSGSQKLIHLYSVLRNTGSPAPITITKTIPNPNNGNDDHFVHSVLVYKIEITDLDYTLSIYDPNHPKTTKTIKYTNEEWTFYDKYQDMHFVGDGIYNQRESFYEIKSDADVNFYFSEYATLLFDIPNRYETTDKLLTFSGEVISGTLKVTGLEVNVNYTKKYTCNLQNDGHFTCSSLMLDEGVNILTFSSTSNALDDDVNIVRHKNYGMIDNTTFIDFFIIKKPEEIAIKNGSFETGSFDNWYVNDLDEPFVPWSVLTSGAQTNAHNHGTFFQIAPTDGSFAAVNGLDGSAGNMFISQAVTIPKDKSTLMFDYSIGWEYRVPEPLIPRVFSVKILRSLGSSYLILVDKEIIKAATNVSTSGQSDSYSLNLNNYAGQTVIIQFLFEIPQYYTGPGLFQIDNIRFD